MTAFLRRSGYVTFSVSQFKHLWADVGATATAYNGHPLANLDPARRGLLFQEWARQLLQMTYPKSGIIDAVPGTCVNGQRRSKAQAEYDFMMNGKKVEVKGGQLCFCSTGSYWTFRVQEVKLHLKRAPVASFDHLYLVLFSPKWLDLVRHDMSTGISKAGIKTNVCGHSIQIRGAKGSSWEDSLNTILGKLCEQGGCSLVGRTSIVDRWITDLCQKHVGFGSHFYTGKPFDSMSPQLRGKRMEKLVLQIDRLLHRDSNFSLPAGEWTSTGSRRGNNNASVDWIRDGKRIEAKHARLVFSKATQQWSCTFYWVKLDRFDELLLAVYSPRGVDVFKHDGTFGLSSTGRATEAKGHIVKISAPRRQPDPMLALQDIHAKLEFNNCSRVASILWDG